MLGVSNEAEVGLNSTHQNMGKFRDAYDHNWSLLANSITDLLFQEPSPYQAYPPGGSTPNLGYYPDHRTASSPHLSPGGLSRPTTSSSWDDRQYARQAPTQTQLPPQANTARQRQPPPNPPTRALGAYPTLNHAHSRTSLRPLTEQHVRSYSEPGTVPTPGVQATRPSPPSTQQTDDPDDLEAAICDVCLKSIRCSQPRVQCTVCYDYDLCLSCFHQGKTSKGHDISHTISHVSDTVVLRYGDLVPVQETVNPPRSEADGRTNWTIVDFQPGTAQNPTDETISSRVLHLFDKNSHARFLAFCKPGHYGIAIDIGVTFDKGLGPQARQTLLQTQGKAGWLRVTLGKAKNNSQFFGTAYNEDSFTDGTMTSTSLPNRLLDPLWGAISQIDLDDKIQLQSSRILHLDGKADESVAVGLILQWSGVAAFQDPSKDPVVSLTIENVRSVKQPAPWPFVIMILFSHASSGCITLSISPNLTSAQAPLDRKRCQHQRQKNPWKRTKTTRRWKSSFRPCCRFSARSETEKRGLGWRLYSGCSSNGKSKPKGTPLLGSSLRLCKRRFKKR